MGQSVRAIQNLPQGINQPECGVLMSPRRAPEEFGEAPLSLVYIAGNTTDAHHAERVLNERNIDYMVSLESFTSESPLVFGGQYHGVFFHVPRLQHRLACELLETAGLRDTVELEADT